MRHNWFKKLNFSFCAKVQRLLMLIPLLQESHSCRISGAVSLCNPFNLVIADEDFHKGFNNVYDRALAGALRRIFKKYPFVLYDLLRISKFVSMR